MGEQTEGRPGPFEIENRVAARDAYFEGLELFDPESLVKWRPEAFVEIRPVRKVAAYVPMTSTALDDIMRTPDLMSEAIDRRLNPWRYPDRNRWPIFVPLPALERARIAAQVAAQRVRDAWSVLRGGEPLSDERSEL